MLHLPGDVEVRMAGPLGGERGQAAAQRLVGR